jgi:hypothetical protein
MGLIKVLCQWPTGTGPFLLLCSWYFQAAQWGTEIRSLIKRTNGGLRTGMKARDGSSDVFAAKCAVNLSLSLEKQVRLGCVC